MSYDTKCYELAEAFLIDEPLTFPQFQHHADRLAQDIQNAIESYLEFDVRKSPDAGVSDVRQAR